MSDSNRIQIAYKAESVAGTAPAGPYQQINVSSASLTQQKNVVQENTIRDDRNLRGLVMTSLIPQGGFGWDFIFGNLDGLLVGQMGSSFSAPLAIVSQAGTAASNVITASAGTPFSAVAVGQWVRITIGATKYLVRVTAVGGSGASITVDGASIPNGGANFTIDGSMMRNGTTMTTYTIEQNHADVATKGFFGYVGMIPNTMSLNCQAEQIVTGDMQFLGMNPVVPANTTISGGAYNAPVTNESFAGLSGNIGTFMVNDSIITPTDMAIKGINCSLNNNVRRDTAINIVRMGWGEFNVQGQLSTYFQGGMAAVDAFYAHTNSSASYAMTDPAGNITVITVLRLKFTNFTRTVGGKNQALMGDLDFQGILDPVTGATFQIDKIAA